MIAEEPIVKSWAVSTESKITQLIDDFIINYPQSNVRKTTSKLLTSLFKKGNEGQRSNVMKLLIQRIQLLNSMGQSSQQFLSLITKIFELFPEEFVQERAHIFNRVLSKTKQIFAKITSSREYQFYSLCSNMIDFGEEFKPYLLQVNGCLKCFGRPDLQFQQTNFSSIKQELRVHLNTTEWVLKRTYQINNLQMNFIKKKINFKSMSIYYYDENGAKKQLGKFTPNDNIPTFNVITNTIGINFQFNKARKNHISCIICSSSEEYAVLCSSCVGKLIDIQGSVKVVAGNPQKINKELTQSFKTINQLRSQLQDFARSVQSQIKITPLRSKIVSQMESCYTSIIRNLKLLRNLSENDLKAQKGKYCNYITDCYSCHFFEFTSCITFIFQILKKPNFKVEVGQLMQLIQDFKKIFFTNKVHALNNRLSSIISELFNRIASINYLQQIRIHKGNSHLIVKLMLNLIEHIKVSHKSNVQLLVDLKKYIFNPTVNSFFTNREKIQLFVMLALSEQYYFFLSDPALEIQKLQDLKRLSIDQYNQYKDLLNFEIKAIFLQSINNIFKLYLVLLPEEYIPVSTLDIVDASYLKYIKNEPPLITDEFMLSNIVFTPNPILKLNIFKLLPQIIQLLPLEQSVELIKQLCKYKPLWNTYIRETVDKFDKMLDAVQKQRKMMLCLEGYEASKEDLYFQHIYRILTPQRTNFIIRLQIPEKQMQKQQKNKGGPVEYIYLPIRQIKSEDLKTDTIGSLHEWITQQIKKLSQDMPFDLIVENNIIDNLDLSLEIIYKKIVQKEAKRQIGNKTYDFFRVIYRIQGIFGEANQKSSGNPRDQKVQQCINFSSHLLNKLSTKKTGLDVLMAIIPTLQGSQNSRDKKDKIIKILSIIFKNQSIIKKIVEWEYGNYILNMAVKYISVNKQQLRATQMLLQMCSKIIDQANLQMVKIRKNSGVFGGRRGSEADMNIEGDWEESEKAVKFVLQRVKQAEENGFKHISKKLIKILPFCSKDDMAASKYLFDYFEVSKIFETKYSQKLTWFLQFIHALSQSYTSFKYICKEQGVTNRLVQLIAAGLKTLQVQKQRQNLDLLQICFTVCKGLIQGDMQLQEFLFEQNILQEIYKVAGIGLGGLTEEKRSKLGKIPLVCFQIIKYFQQGKMISNQVHDYFTKNEEQKKKSIQVQKTKLKELIMSKKKKAMESYQHLWVNQNDEVLSCSSCKQGYQKKKQVLGVYLYSTKSEILSLQGWWKDNKKHQSITSTSYFEPIHLECHIEAMKDDLKLQKTEWEGAIIRNSQVLCNNWCPFRGPETTDQQFDKSLKKYFEKNNKNASFWMALNDLNGLLQKFSKQYNFAIQTKGSSYTHNAKLIPVLMVIACHLLKNNEDFKYIRDGMAFIESNLTKKPNLVHLYFCLLLFNTTYVGFISKKGFYLRLIDNLSYGNFKDSKPFYVQLALIQSIMKTTHNNLSEGSDIITHLNSFIVKNFGNLLQSFEVIAQQYKNLYLKWQNLQQVRQYFEQS